MNLKVSLNKDESSSKKYRYHRDGSQPNIKREIFVFGSNTAGIHGAGAARQAKLYYGAKSGQGIGITGRCYAIPTKNHNLETLPLDTISTYVDRFKKLTLRFPEVRFFVTRIGCGLAGYADSQIAPMFRGCESNCSFPSEWKPYLEL